MDNCKKKTRSSAKYESKNEKFMLKVQRYRGQQYSQLYFARLMLMKPSLLEQAKQECPHVPVSSILKLEEGHDCILIGTLYKHMKLKPSILEDYSKERSNKPLITASRLVSEDDYLILEEESGRVKLTGPAANAAIYATGLVAAVRGVEQKDGDFFATQIIVPDLPPQQPLPSGGFESPKFVALVGGLELGGNATNPLASQLLVDHLTGHLGGSQEERQSAAIVHVVIAGNSVGMRHELSAGQPLSGKDQVKLIAPVKELDLALTQLSSALPVDIMPGASDPANFSLPQQPLHPCLFPGAVQYSTFRNVTNPHEFELDGILFLGSSGQNIDDLEKYTTSKDRLELMERTMRWRHLAPTAPDTLGCYPFTDADPFIVERCPHVYFAANQPSFSTRIVKGPAGQSIRLITLPRFAESGVAVLVNLANLECQLLTFSISCFE